jgi:hypothetical protein
VGGVPQVCDPLAGAIPETCNGIDDNCDGVIDDGNPGGGGACTTGLPGVCGDGTLQCQGGVLQCVADAGSPEVCDGLDNDCNGATDDGLGQTTCGVGECEVTADNCVGGVPQTCTPGTPVMEVCADGLDNDCDGEVDDVDVCGLGSGGDYYMDYKAKKSKTDSTPSISGAPAVTLVDPTWGETADYTFKKERAILLPASTNLEGITDPDTHLLSYQIKVASGSSKHAKRVGVQVTNQFHVTPLTLKTLKADRLFVPTLKDLQNPVGSPPNAASHNVDHYKCYRVKASAFSLISGVSVSDQFEDRKYDLKKPRRLCNAVEKNGEGIKNADAHLLCYQAKRASGEAKHAKRLGVNVNTQLPSPAQMDTKKENQLCVPTEIVDIGTLK